MVALLGAAAVLAAGCERGDGGGPAVGVTTPPPSATVGPTGGTGTPPAKGPPPTPPPATPPAATPPAGTPLGTYEGLVTGWQGARSAFFTAVSDGRRRTLAQQRALAAAYLAGSRRFAAGLAATRWPAAAVPAVRRLRAVNAEQQSRLAAMSTAPSAGAFTARLADYGTGAARENAAVAAVRVALS